MLEIHSGSAFILHDDYGITLLSVGQRLMYILSWVHCGSTGIFLALTVSELRAIFLCPDSKFVYLIVSLW